MKKIILFVLFLTFVPTMKGAESKRATNRILQYYLNRAQSKEENYDDSNVPTIKKVESNQETERKIQYYLNRIQSKEAKNDKSDKELSENLEKALHNALKKYLKKVIEKANEIDPEQTSDEITDKKAKEHISGKVLDDKAKQKTPEQSKDKVDIDKTLNKALNKALDKALDTTLDKVLDKTIEKKPDNNISVSAWVGYGYYAMNEFNRKLSIENNKNIDGGLNIGIEFPFKGFKVKGLDLSPFPIGVEYLDADSKTKHTSNGMSTTVNWELPVVGIYFWPEVRSLKLSDKWRDEKGWDLRLRPLGVGYYTLGKIMDAELDVSDSKGYLEVEDEAIGIMSQIGIEYVNEKKTFKAYIESGYRSLKFTSVMRKPKSGFTGGSPSTMPEDLDYSGFIIKTGLCMKF